MSEAPLPLLRPTKPMALVGKGHPALRTVALRVVNIDDKLIALASRMYATCIKAHGLAVAACQVGEPIDMVVTSNGLAYLNTIVTPVAEHGGAELGIEGCLTLPGRWYPVTRARKVELTAMALNGDTYHVERVDLAARMWQHEADHLRGLVLCDHYVETTNKVTPLPTGAGERLAAHATGRDPGPLR